MSLKNKMFIALGVIWFFTGTTVIGPLVAALVDTPYLWLVALVAAIVAVRFGVYRAWRNHHLIARRDHSTEVERVIAK